MAWMLWVLAVLVVGGCVVVAVGRGGQMHDVYDDRPDVLVPGDRPLGADDLRAVRFTTAFRGYRMSEVDALIARLAAELGIDPAAPAGDDASEPLGPDKHNDVTGFTRGGEAGGRAS